MNAVVRVVRVRNSPIHLVSFRNANESWLWSRQNTRRRRLTRIWMDWITVECRRNMEVPNHILSMNKLRCQLVIMMHVCCAKLVAGTLQNGVQHSDRFANSCHDGDDKHYVIIITISLSTRQFAVLRRATKILAKKLM